MSAVFACTFFAANWLWDAFHRKLFAGDGGEVALVSWLAKFFNHHVALVHNDFATVVELVQRLSTRPSLFLTDFLVVFCPRVYLD